MGYSILTNISFHISCWSWFSVVCNISFVASGSAFLWVSFFHLNDHSQPVAINRSHTNQVARHSGISQGSVLSSILISPICQISHKHNSLVQQMLLIFNFTSLPMRHISSAKTELKVCLSTLRIWFGCSGLAINPEKSKAILFTIHPAYAIFLFTFVIRRLTLPKPKSR